MERLRTLLTATEQAAQTFAEKQAEESFHPQLEALLVTWITSKLPDSVKTRAYNRRSQPSVRILLTEFYFTLLPQPSEQARHLGNLVKNPTSACANPVEVITSIENWRVSVQLCKESTGQMPIQEDIKTAFEKLINPVLKNVTGFDWKRTYCEQTAYLSITTTDDQVHAYITSVMEVMHRHKFASPPVAQNPQREEKTPARDPHRTTPPRHRSSEGEGTLENPRPAKCRRRTAHPKGDPKPAPKPTQGQIAKKWQEDLEKPLSQLVAHQDVRCRVGRQQQRSVSRGARNPQVLQKDDCCNAPLPQSHVGTSKGSRDSHGGRRDPDTTAAGTAAAAAAAYLSRAPENSTGASTGRRSTSSSGSSSISSSSSTSSSSRQGRVRQGAWRQEGQRQEGREERWRQGSQRPSKGKSKGKRQRQHTCRMHEDSAAPAHGRAKRMASPTAAAAATATASPAATTPVQTTASQTAASASQRDERKRRHDERHRHDEAKRNDEYDERKGRHDERHRHDDAVRNDEYDERKGQHDERQRAMHGSDAGKRSSNWHADATATASAAAAASLPATSDRHAHAAAAPSAAATALPAKSPLMSTFAPREGSSNGDGHEQHRRPLLRRGALQHRELKKENALS